MPSVRSLVLALGAGAQVAHAHGFSREWIIDEQSFPGFNQTYLTDKSKVGDFIAWSEVAGDLGFVPPSKFSHPDIICHTGAVNAKLNKATVKAGGTVRARWTDWPKSHAGPSLVYVAAAEDPLTVDKTTLKWIKIQEQGLIKASEPAYWASDRLRENNNTEDITIPATLRPGNYVLRHELIALHDGGRLDGAQHYPQCVNIIVTGSGTELPEGVLGTELYKPGDAGIHFQLYVPLTTYPIPGPRLAFAQAVTASGAYKNPVEVKQRKGDRKRRLR